MKLGFGIRRGWIFFFVGGLGNSVVLGIDRLFFSCLVFIILVFVIFVSSFVSSFSDVEYAFRFCIVVLMLFVVIMDGGYMVKV